MTLQFDDTHIDATIWQALSDSSCAADFRSYLRHAPEKAAHREEATIRLERIDAEDGDGPPRYPEALAAILAMAEAGDATAAFHAGKMFANGFGTPACEASAERWYRLAALQGEWRARVNLALLLLDRTESGESLDEALGLLAAAAAAGLGFALQTLARLHLAGKGVEKDPARAFELLLEAWKAGDASAACFIGELMLRGILRGGERSAVEWLERAADAGHARALVLLGRLHEEEGELEAAVECYRRAAPDDDDAAKALGTLYLEGKGVPRDGAEAFKWLFPAALRGHVEAQLNLGVAYRHGIGVLPNRQAALKWLGRAAAAGDPDASCRLGEMLIEDDDPQGAARAYADAAREGHPTAQARLGLMLWQGRGVERDEARAYRWIRLAALQNDPMGLFLLGWATQTGVGVEADPAGALRWFRKGAELGDVPCQYRLGLAHLTGQGTERDVAEAACWLTRAADAGSSDAERAIGLMFLHGDGVREDAGEASKWLLAAAEKHNAAAQYTLAKLYEEGRGLARNPAEARRWMKAAAQLGDPDALDWLRAAEEAPDPQTGHLDGA